MRHENQNSSPLLSIIVPVYNVEQYLEKCLTSIAEQTLNPETFEVILVDDCSTDNSLEICRDFCKKYKNFKLESLKEHSTGGAGTPSNRGLDLARGKYIGFVDSDDYVKPNMFEILLKKGLKDGSDIVICDFRIHQLSKDKLLKSNDYEQWKRIVALCTHLELRKLKSMVLSLSAVPWRKLYKKDFIERFSIRYPEGDFFYEDNPLHWFTTVQANSFSFVDIAPIIHSEGRKGQTMERKPERLLAFIRHAIIIKDFLKDKSLDKEYRIDFINWLLTQSSWVSWRLKNLRKKYLNELRFLLSDVTYADLVKCDLIQQRSRGEIFYRYNLVHGWFWIGLSVKGLFYIYAYLRKRFRL